MCGWLLLLLLLLAVVVLVLGSRLLVLVLGIRLLVLVLGGVGLEVVVTVAVDFLVFLLILAEVVVGALGLVVLIGH